MKIIDFNDDEKVINIDDEMSKKAKQNSSLDVKEKKEPKPVSDSEEKTEPDSENDDSESFTVVGALKELLSLVIYLGVTFIIVYCIITFVGQRTVVNGVSMEDTLSNGDNIIVDKISPNFKDFERFEVIIFPPKGEPDNLYIKRIIGLPGETVYIDTDGTIYINQTRLDENYGTEVIRVPGLAAQTIQLADDEYFVLGDNRNNSLDSRFEKVGNVKRDDITGRAWLRFFPFSKWGLVKNLE